MIDHTGIGVADVTRSARFYDAALRALGLRRVMRMPENVGTDGIGYGVDTPSSGSIGFTRILPTSTRRSWRRTEPRSTLFSPQHSRKEELTMGHRASADRVTTPRLSLIPTATASRRCFAATDTVKNRRARV